MVKAATGEEVTAEELGGADVHTKISGVADHLAADDIEAIKICRNCVASFSQPDKQVLETKSIDEPIYDVSELYGLISDDSKKQIDVHELIARIVDGSRFSEFKAEYGKSLITGFAHIMGFPVGIIGNNSFLTSESSLKGAHFVQLCNQRKTPVLFLQNITGFVVGRTFEHGGIARDGAKFIHAVANLTVPKLTLVFGNSYGAGNYAMAGRAFDPNFLFMWPNSRISVMGGEQAEMVLKSVGNKKAEVLIDQFKEEETALHSTSRVWDDGVIDPADTRKILALAISVTLNKKFEAPNYGIFRM